MRNVVLFCGGTGAKSLIQELISDEKINLTLLINCFDNGKTTGKLRSLVPGFLGPSDFRKNIVHSLDSKHPDFKVLKSIFTTRDSSMNLVEQVQTPSIKYFLNKILKNSINLLGDELSDVALGNILILGAFLENNRNFNAGLEDFNKLLPLRAKIMNISDGSNLYLAAKLNKGRLIGEEEIVQLGDAGRVIELGFYLDQDFKSKRVKPTVNEAALGVLTNADIILYGPGTPYSSIIPSLMIEDVFNEILLNKKASKFYIDNLRRDLDSLNDNLECIFQKIDPTSDLNLKEFFSVIISSEKFKNIQSVFKEEIKDSESLHNGRKLWQLIKDLC